MPLLICNFNYHGCVETGIFRESLIEKNLERQSVRSNGLERRER